MASELTASQEEQLGDELAAAGADEQYEADLKAAMLESRQEAAEWQTVQRKRQHGEKRASSGEPASEEDEELQRALLLSLEKDSDTEEGRVPPAGARIKREERKRKKRNDGPPPAGADVVSLSDSDDNTGERAAAKASRQLEQAAAGATARCVGLVESSAL